MYTAVCSTSSSKINNKHYDNYNCCNFPILYVSSSGSLLFLYTYTSFRLHFKVYACTYVISIFIEKWLLTLNEKICHVVLCSETLLAKLLYTKPNVPSQILPNNNCNHYIVYIDIFTMKCFFKSYLHLISFIMRKKADSVAQFNKFFMIYVCFQDGRRLLKS